MEFSDLEPKRRKKTLNRTNVVKYRNIEVKDIANYCMVSTSTVRRWLNAGKIKAIKLPSNQFRINVEDFKEFLERYNIPIDNRFFQ